MKFVTIWGADTSENVLADVNIHWVPSSSGKLNGDYTGLKDILRYSGLTEFDVMFGLPESFLSGFEVKENKIAIENFINKWERTFEEYYLKINLYDVNGKEIFHTSKSSGTGTIIEFESKFKSNSEKLRVVMYGDTTGDGKISVVDALAIIKHINNKIMLPTEAHIEAGRVREESHLDLSAVDALAIMKHLNNKYEISQGL